MHGADAVSLPSLSLVKVAHVPPIETSLFLPHPGLVSKGIIPILRPYRIAPFHGKKSTAPNNPGHVCIIQKTIKDPYFLIHVPIFNIYRTIRMP